MSTHIKDIKGIVESDRSTFERHYTEETEMSLNRYYGGKKNGLMLQLTCFNDKGYIQLTQKQVKKLIKVLKNSFNHKIYPSE